MYIFYQIKLILNTNLITKKFIKTKIFKKILNKKIIKTKILLKQEHGLLI